MNERKYLSALIVHYMYMYIISLPLGPEGEQEGMEGCMGEHHMAHPEPPVGQVLQVWAFGTVTNQILSKYTGQHALIRKLPFARLVREITKILKWIFDLHLHPSWHCTMRANIS